jgi:signal transduction histidine kinase
MLEYAGLGRWLTGRMLVLLFAPSVISCLFILSNPMHHLFWAYTSLSASYAISGPVGWATLGIGYLMGFVGFAVFIWLFIRSPRHRWPVALCLLAQVIIRSAFLIDLLNVDVLPGVDVTIPAFTVTTGLYALALFGFNMLDPIHLGRTTVIEQMREGMLVLDGYCRVVDSNRAAQSILNLTEASIKGKPIQALLPGCEALRDEEGAGEPAPLEISMTGSLGLRFYSLHLSPLDDQPGHPIGQLLLIEDVTEARQARLQLLEQQRALATLQERSRLARELHDNAGQVLAYVSLQAQAIQKYIQEGNTSQAETQLERLAGIAQQGHRDLREDILNLKVGSGASWSFLAALVQHLDAYRENYGIRTALQLPDDLADELFEPEEGVQLLRVIQEALTNAHRHGGAHQIGVRFELQDSRVRIVVADDGCGFMIGDLLGAPGDHFGLAFMHDRMQQIGGSLEVISHPGAGTQIILTAPVNRTEPL